jgi:NAD(P)-dependent dehydrogenase (short-subunit alcohol dehydrogenase family)
MKNKEIYIGERNMIALQSMLASDTLKNKVAIITGGGTGLGREIALEYARLGAKVIVASRKIEKLEETVSMINEEGGEGKAITVDVREPAEVDALVAEADRHYGHIDILVNGAAGSFPISSEKLSINGWNAVVGIVLHGTFYCTRAVGKYMIAKKIPGRFLNIVTPLAWTGNPGAIHSAAAKAGVIALTRTLAVEWAKYDMRVNALAPGIFPTEQVIAQLMPDPVARDNLKNNIPLKRFGDPREVANAAAYLVSNYADFVNGEVFTIDAGEWLGRGEFPYE